nr:hypothetical protein [Microbacterium sp. C5A9]
MPLDHPLDELIERSAPRDVVLGIDARFMAGTKAVEAKIVERPLNAATTALLLFRREDHFPSPSLEVMWSL